MRKCSILLPCLFGLLGTAVAVEAAAMRPSALYDGGRQEPPAAAESRSGETGGALLRMEESFHDFGTVERRGGDLVHEFRFVNAGDAPLVIVRAVTSCSCLKASFPRRPVPAGGEGTIRIVYEPHKSESGTFHKVVHLYSNSADGRHIVAVQGCALDDDGRQPKRQTDTDL